MDSIIEIADFTSITGVTSLSIVVNPKPPNTIGYLNAIVVEEE